MGKLTDAQKNFDVSQFFERESIEDALENDRCGICKSTAHFREDCTYLPGDPVLQQVRDPETNEVYGPGLKVTEDGRVIRLGEGSQD